MVIHAYVDTRRKINKCNIDSFTVTIPQCKNDAKFDGFFLSFFFSGMQLAPGS